MSTQICTGLFTNVASTPYFLPLEQQVNEFYLRNLTQSGVTVGSISQAASALGADVYNIFIPGQESYDMVDLDGYSAQFIYAPPEIASPRLRLYQTAGWKMAQVFNTTNTSWALNLRCTLAVAL